MHLCLTEICLDSRNRFLANILSGKRNYKLLRLSGSIEVGRKINIPVSL